MHRARWLVLPRPQSVRSQGFGRPRVWGASASPRPRASRLGSRNPILYVDHDVPLRGPAVLSGSRFLLHPRDPGRQNCYLLVVAVRSVIGRDAPPFIRLCRACSMPLRKHFFIGNGAGQAAPGIDQRVLDVQQRASERPVEAAPSGRGRGYLVEVRRRPQHRLDFIEESTGVAVFRSDPAHDDPWRRFGRTYEAQARVPERHFAHPEHQCLHRSHAGLSVATNISCPRIRASASRARFVSPASRAALAR